MEHSIILFNTWIFLCGAQASDVYQATGKFHTPWPCLGNTQNNFIFYCSCFPVIITSPQTLLNLWQGFKTTLGRSDIAFYCLVWGAYWGGNECAGIQLSFVANGIASPLYSFSHFCNWLRNIINWHIAGVVHFQNSTSM